MMIELDLSCSRTRMVIRVQSLLPVQSLGSVLLNNVAVAVVFALSERTNNEVYVFNVRCLAGRLLYT